jgi:hypothetical protein
VLVALWPCVVEEWPNSQKVSLRLPQNLEHIGGFILFPLTLLSPVATAIGDGLHGRNEQSKCKILPILSKLDHNVLRIQSLSVTGTIYLECPDGGTHELSKMRIVSAIMVFLSAARDRGKTRFLRIATEQGDKETTSDLRTSRHSAGISQASTEHTYHQ